MPDACMSSLPQWLQGGLFTCTKWDAVKNQHFTKNADVHELHVCSTY